ncbi:hypothetical protein C9J18_09465 [Photobacterium phosphoreum]|uniref:Uncharacterized protein n=1 Tax=Photobacterium phosphoreum TaxID=659 RepID=A0A2T3JT73_PHOPO|nr:hypothetical protein C9J18_09465 [Photobacterium phosphoreum]
MLVISYSAWITSIAYVNEPITYFTQLNIELILVECKSQQFWAQKCFIHGINTEDPTVVYLCSNIEAL